MPLCLCGGAVISDWKHICVSETDQKAILKHKSNLSSHFHFELADYQLNESLKIQNVEQHHILHTCPHRVGQTAAF